MVFVYVNYQKLRNRRDLPPPLSKKVELELLTRFCASEDKAEKTKLRNKLILHNLRFVTRMAIKEGRGSGHNVDELYAEGCLGLIEGLDNYDISHGSIRLISYAIWHMKKGFSSYKKTTNIIKHNKTKKSEEKRLEKEGKEKDPNSPLHFKFFSLDQPVTGTDDMTLQDVIPDAEASADVDTIEKDTNLKVREILECLPERDNKVVSSYFGIGFEERKTLKDISKELSISQERCRQIIEKAKKNILLKAKEYGLD